MAKAFVGATIIPIEGDIIENGTILVDGGIIQKIGNDVDTTGAEIIDCSGKFITPGLIDAHSHVGLYEEGLTTSEFGDGNEMTSPVTPYLRALDAIYPEDLGFKDALSGGVTCLGVTPGSGNLIGGQFCVVKTYGSIIDEMVLREPAGVKMALGENPRRVYKNQDKTPSTRMANAHLIREAFYKAIDYRHAVSSYEEQKQIEDRKPEENRSLYKQPETQMANEVLLKILSGTIPVRCHSHRADDIITAIRLSQEFGYQLVIDHATESYKIADYIVQREIPVVVGPLMTSRSKPELRDRTLKTPGIMMEAGAHVCITTDAPVIPIYMLRESVILASREGLEPGRALETVTINPAKILGVDDRVGSLVEGKDADFAIWDGHPMDARTTIVSTYIDGNEVFTKGDEST